MIAVLDHEPEREGAMASVKDVVCRVQIIPATASFHQEYQGATYYFCSHDCHAKFMAEPQKYASQMVETRG